MVRPRRPRLWRALDEAADLEVDEAEHRAVLVLLAEAALGLAGAGGEGLELAIVLELVVLVHVEVVQPQEEGGDRLAVGGDDPLLEEGEAEVGGAGALVL